MWYLNFVLYPHLNLKQLFNKNYNPIKHSLTRTIFKNISHHTFKICKVNIKLK